MACKTLAILTLTLCCSTLRAAEPPPGWTPLFNGQDLSGWIPKIRGYPVGEDPLDTFSVVDGAISVGYENYGAFDNRFGHLFYETPLSGDYSLRIEYRFTGEQAPGGAGWAFRNSGVMFHAQSPDSMGLDQDFPISLEAQFLGGKGTGERPTHNLCTPGTHVTMDGELVTRHCVVANAPTFSGNQWVTVDVFVQGTQIRHVIDGNTVLEYSHPVVGGGMVSGHDPAAKADGNPLAGGYIALQSESHPVQFRQVLLRKL